MKPFGSALLSYGHSGQAFHAPFLAIHPGFKLLGAWERSKSLVKADYPDARLYHSIQEVLEDPSVDLVVVNTPTYTHFEYAEKALSAGKHIVVEKAFTTTVDEAQRLEALATRSGKLIAVFQNRRWDSDFLAVAKVVRSGDLGDIIEAQFSFERYNPAIGPKVHKEEPGPGAGNLMDLGPHVVDQALVLFGMPQEVFADIRTCRLGSKVDDYFEILLYYPTLRVRLRSTYFASEPGPAFLIHGTKGSLQMPRLDVQESQLRKGMMPNDPSYGKVQPGVGGTLTQVRESGNQVTRIDAGIGMYMEFFNMLSAALEGKGSVPVTASEGTNVMRVLEASQKSSRQGTKVSLQRR